MKKILLLSCFLCVLITLQAQKIQRCATHEVFLKNSQRYPGYAEAVENAFNTAKEYAKKKQSSSFKKGSLDTIYHIPVVVHIVYNTPEQNIDDSLVYNQIEVLNRDYRRLNPDTSDTRDIFKPFAADAGIEFFLAETDPDGNPTNGITRTQTAKDNFALGLGGNTIDNVKSSTTGGADAWDTKRYLNIWVCNMEDANSFLGVVLGFAYPPDGAPNWPANMLAPAPEDQGVVIHYKVFGRNNPAATGQIANVAGEGRTVVHEVGHYLGLRHIWGDGILAVLTGTPDCSVDDGIEDTPNSGTNSQMAGCDTTKNTCTDTSGIEYPDMFENYMDYSKERCQNMFTQGQVDIMRAMLATARKDLPEITVLGISGISSQWEEIADFEVYPNPAKGMVEVRFNSGHPALENLTVLNVLGRDMKKISLEQSRDKVTVDLSGFPAGIYFLRATDGKRNLTKKLILQ